MKSFLLYCCFCFLICFSNIAFGQLNNFGSTFYKWHISAYSGFFTQNFSWSIAGNYAGQNPNIYSELTWKKISGSLIAIKFQHRLNYKIFLSGAINYNWITSGNVTDIDYNGDNRTNQSYYAVFKTNEGSLLASNLSVGYIVIEKKRITFEVSLGYGLMNEKLKIRSDATDSSIIATDLNSSYNINTIGPLISIQLKYAFTPKFTVSFSPRFQIINYNGKGDWNLVTDFKHPVSFRHISTGYHLNNAVRFEYAFNHKINLFINLQNEMLKVHGGDDVLYKSSGDILISHFNGAKGNTNLVGIGLVYHR